MPLTFNYRDEHNQRINNALQRLMALTLVPGGWDDDAVNQLLRIFLLKVTDLAQLPTPELVTFISRYKVDFENIELLADALTELSKKPGFKMLVQHSLALYEYIQQANDTFSITVDGKIKALKKL